MDSERQADGLLIRRLLAGSEESWTALYRKHRSSVFAFALHMSGSREIAEETVQETFIAFLDRVSQFDSSMGSLESYLIGIARNKVLHLSCRRWREVSVEAVAEAVEDSDLLADLATRERRDTLRRAVLALPEPYRAAIVLCELQESSYQEAAVALNCPIGTVRSRLHRARQMLIERIVGKGCLV